ncbi:MAG: hypothetical protein M3345_07100 [Actinomycetota bacterium]|nr:hypothetical protein [Actinomycetota bacterium]
MDTATSGTSNTKRTIAILIASAALAVWIPGAATRVEAGEPGQSLRSAIPTVQAWIDAVHEGRMRAAWRLTADRSRRAFGGFEGFKGEEAGLREGWGTWAAGTDVTYERRTVTSSDQEAASVVTLFGTVTQEGSTRRRAAAMPVYTVSGETKVEPIGGRADVLFLNPHRHGQILSSTPTFEAQVKPGGHATVDFFVLGHRGIRTEATMRQLEGRHYEGTLHLTEPLSPGRHVVTLSVFGGDAGFHAVPVIFKVRS